MTAAREPLVVEWGSAGAALDGADSGDACVVAPFPGGALVAVIDGLGHGPEARDATREAVRILEACAGEPLGALVERCHEALRKTRGAVMSLAAFDARAASLSWLGVGNVEGFLLRAAPGGRPRESLTLRGGVVGYQLPPLRPAALSVARGDTLVMATDGIRSAFVADLAPSPRPQELADAILARHARGTDDALVLVARYAGGER